MYNTHRERHFPELDLNNAAQYVPMTPLCLHKMHFVPLQKVNLSSIFFMVKRFATVLHVSSKFREFVCQLDRRRNFDRSGPYSE